jgi:hypothetical protein
MQTMKELSAEMVQEYRPYIEQFVKVWIYAIEPFLLAQCDRSHLVECVKIVFDKYRQKYQQNQISCIYRSGYMEDYFESEQIEQKELEEVSQQYICIMYEFNDEVLVATYSCAEIHQVRTFMYMNYNIVQVLDFQHMVSTYNILPNDEFLTQFTTWFIIQKNAQDQENIHEHFIVGVKDNEDGYQYEFYEKNVKNAI